MGVETAGGVTMTTSVAGVKEPIQQYSVQGIHKLPYPNLVPGNTTRNLNRTKQNLPTPINPSKLEYLLLVSGYPQHQIDTLVKGFTEGFDIGYLGDRNNTLESNNLKSCLNSEEIVENKLTKEINRGHISEG